MSDSFLVIPLGDFSAIGHAFRPSTKSEPLKLGKNLRSHTNLAMQQNTGVVTARLRLAPGIFFEKSRKLHQSTACFRDHDLLFKDPSDHLIGCMGTIMELLG